MSYLPRKCVPDLEFNGKKANTELDGYLQSVKYTDVADGESDTIDITLQNIEKRWLKGWWPKKKDVIVAKFKFKNWNKTGDSLLFRCGRFTLDSVKYSGGPIICEMSAVAMPKSSKFQSRKRTQTWKDVTLKQVGQRIAKRYNLGFRYDAKMVKISKLEQSEEDDCSFLKKLAEKYDLGMKIYRSKIVIWDMSAESQLHTSTARCGWMMAGRLTLPWKAFTPDAASPTKTPKARKRTSMYMSA